MRTLSIKTGITAIVLASAMMAQNAIAQADTSGLSSGTIIFTESLSSVLEGISNSRAGNTFLSGAANTSISFSEFDTDFGSFGNRQPEVPSAGSTFETDNLVNFVQEVEDTNTGNDDTDLGDFVGTFVDIQSQSTGDSTQQVVDSLVDDILSNFPSDDTNTLVIDLEAALRDVSTSSTVTAALLF